MTLSSLGPKHECPMPYDREGQDWRLPQPVTCTRFAGVLINRRDFMTSHGGIAGTRQTVPNVGHHRSNDRGPLVGQLPRRNISQTAAQSIEVRVSKARLTHSGMSLAEQRPARKGQA